MKKYIEMLQAEGAKWIQGGWEPKTGDSTDQGFTVGTPPKILASVQIRDKSGWINQWPKSHLLWLPSIEDLLGMLGNEGYLLSEFLVDLEQFVRGSSCPFEMVLYKNIKSVILCFIQHELKGLHWKGWEWK